MSDIKSIDLRELQVIINRLLEHIIVTRGVEKVVLNQDYYWQIPTEEIYDVVKDVKQHEVGSLYDDLEFVRSLLKQDVEPVALQLTEVAPLLRFIGETVKEF